MILREKRELEQVHLCLGSRGFPQQGDERYAAALFNTILGGGMSSRLFQRIREKEGLVYTVMSYHNGYVNGGYEAIYAACAPKNLKRVLDMTLAEMRLIKQRRRDRRGAELGEAAPQRIDPAVARIDGQPDVRARPAGVLLRPPVLPRRDHRGHRCRDARRHRQRRRTRSSIPIRCRSRSLGNLKSPGISTDMLRQAVA